MKKMWFILPAAMLIGACGKSNSTVPATAPASSGDRIKQNVAAAGQDLKAAATEAATQVKPAFERAKQEGREAIHSAAQKVADWTATQPAASPATQPGE